MTRQQALSLLRGYGDVSFEVLDEVFSAFDFESVSPTFETQVYYHPRYACGKFTARDDGLHLLTEEQKGIALQMLKCVVFNERYSSSS